VSTIGLAGVDAGIGIVFAALVDSFARNPSLRQQLFGFTILGFTLTEAIGLFPLMMAFFILLGYCRKKKFQVSKRACSMTCNISRHSKKII